MPTLCYSLSVDKKTTEREVIVLTNSKLLREKIKQSGYRISFIADKMGITYQAFLNKINNESEFKAREIQVLHDILKLSTDERDAIFFAA